MGAVVPESDVDVAAGTVVIVPGVLLDAGGGGVPPLLPTTAKLTEMSRRMPSFVKSATTSTAFWSLSRTSTAALPLLSEVTHVRLPPFGSFAGQPQAAATRRRP